TRRATTSACSRGGRWVNGQSLAASTGGGLGFSLGGGFSQETTDAQPMNRRKLSTRKMMRFLFCCGCCINGSSLEAQGASVLIMLSIARRNKNPDMIPGREEPAN